LLKSNILLKAEIVQAKDGPEDFPAWKFIFRPEMVWRREKIGENFPQKWMNFFSLPKMNQVRCSPGQTLDLSEKRATFIQCPFWDIIMPQDPAVYGAPACAGAGDEGEGIFPPF